MPGLAEELRTLAGRKRTRKNFEAIKQQLAELAEQAESASEYLESLSEIREAVGTLSDQLDSVADDNPLVGDVGTIRDAAAEFLAALPDDDEPITTLVEEAQEASDEYEEAIEDREYTAEVRDEIWGTLCDALDNIANAIPGGKETGGVNDDG